MLNFGQVPQAVMTWVAVMGFTDGLSPPPTVNASTGRVVPALSFKMMTTAVE